MVCIVSFVDKPTLRRPVLIEGLPGIGFVANLSARHLIRELNAKLFAKIHCSSFQDFAVTAKDGQTHYPVNELYYHKGTGKERDLIILHGNTQALTTRGQYELCGKILDISEMYGSDFVITLGGLKRDKEMEKPNLFFAATDSKIVRQMSTLGVEIIKGQIFGVAGLLVGIGGLRGLKGLCLLAETLGLYPDVVAANEILTVICDMLNLNVKLESLEETAEVTRDLLENFGLIEESVGKTRKEESQYRWFV